MSNNLLNRLVGKPIEGKRIELWFFCFVLDCYQYHLLEKDQVAEFLELNNSEMEEFLFLCESLNHKTKLE